MSDAPPRWRRDARLLKAVVFRFADVDVAAAVAEADAEVDAAVKDSVIAADEDDVWELDVHPEEVVVAGPDAKVADFPRSDADDVAADAENVRVVET